MKASLTRFSVMTENFSQEMMTQSCNIFILAEPHFLLNLTHAHMLSNELLPDK